MNRTPASPHLLRGTILSDDEGVALIELAAILPLLLLLIMGTIDLSRIVAAGLDLEQAAQRTTDFALSKRPRSSDGTYLRDEAVAASGVAASNVTVDIYLECDGVRQSSFGAVCPTGQTRARYASVAILDQVKPGFDWAGFASYLGFQLPPTVAIRGDSIVRFQ